MIQIDTVINVVVGLISMLITFFAYHYKKDRERIALLEREKANKDDLFFLKQEIESDTSLLEKHIDQRFNNMNQRIDDFINAQKEANALLKQLVNRV